jgi:hypothetical protein
MPNTPLTALEPPTLDSQPLPITSQPVLAPSSTGAPDRASRRRRGLYAAALLGAAAYSGLASELDLTRFRPLLVALPMVAAAVAALRSWVHHDRVRKATALHPRPRFGGLHHRAIVRWSILASVLIAWEAHELTNSPRVSYPTVTSIVGTVTSFRPVYALAFLAWLVLGYRLIERGK